MRNRGSLNNIITNDRKILYIILSIVIVSALTLTVVYAALSTTLNINGQAEVSAANWDIYLDNIDLNSSSATTNVPTITNKTTATFSTTLSKPGDYYMFTIDIVNNGSIDAMIDSVTKTPELTDTQKKYLNYIIEYQNGESITTKQLVSKKSFVRLKVKVEFRKDLTASDLPTTSETLNLSFKVNYVQSDDNNENVNITNNGKLIKIVSGNIDTVGSEICIGNECFYIISSNDDSVTMLAKYNLQIGTTCTSTTACTPIENPSGIQDPTMIGIPEDGEYPRYGTTAFSSTNYWYDGTTLKSEYSSTLPTFVYDSNAIIYKYVENYKMYLESQGFNIEEARVIKYEELVNLGCDSVNNTCTSASEWVYATSYWTGSTGWPKSIISTAQSIIWRVDSDGRFFNRSSFSLNNALGVRPVITVSKTQF